MNTKLCAAFAGALSLVAGAAMAAPFTYSFHQEQAAGTLNGVPFGGTYDWTVTADTTTAAATAVGGAPGFCVTGTASTISINGGAAITVTTPLFVCMRDDDTFAGFYKAPGDTTQFPTLTVGVLPGADLTAAGAFPIPAGSLHNHGASGGDVATSAGPLITTGPENNNLVGSTFTITAAAPPATIPTLTEWAMILLAAALAGVAGLTLHRRRQVI